MYEAMRVEGCNARNAAPSMRPLYLIALPLPSVDLVHRIFCPHEARRRCGTAKVNTVRCWPFVGMAEGAAQPLERPSLAILSADRGRLAVEQLSALVGRHVVAGDPYLARLRDSPLFALGVGGQLGLLRHGGVGRGPASQLARRYPPYSLTGTSCSKGDSVIVGSRQKGVTYRSRSVLPGSNGVARTRPRAFL